MEKANNYEFEASKKCLKKAPYNIQPELVNNIFPINNNIPNNQSQVEMNVFQIYNNKVDNNIQGNDNNDTYINNNVLNDIKLNEFKITKNFHISDTDNNITKNNNIIYDNSKNILNANIDIKNNLNINNEKKNIVNYNMINNHYYEISGNDYNNKENNNNTINKNDDKSVCESKSNSTSNINKTTSQIYNSDSNRSSSKTVNANFLNNNNASNKINKNYLKNNNSNIFNQHTHNSKKVQKKFEASQWNNNTSEQNNSIRKAVSPYLHQAGVNLVGLNIDNNQEEDDCDYIRMSCFGNKKSNLRLEGIGVSSPNSHKIVRKNIRLQGISTEAPLKISAAFGRTAYTFIDKNNEKNKLYSIKLAKKNKINDKNNLDIFFAPNNK